jgi:hypothetical protein
MLAEDLLQAALHALLGYAPCVVHCAADSLAGVWRDMQVCAIGGFLVRGRQG